MKKTFLTLALFAGLSSAAPAFAGTDSYIVSSKDIHEGYVVKKIWLSNFAVPAVSLSDVTFSSGETLPADAMLSDPQKLVVNIGMERGHPFAIVRVPAFSAGATTGAVNRISGFTLSVTETSNPTVATAAKTTDATSSVLATGTWFKIGITKSGFHKIDYNFINSLGVNPATINPTNIRIFGNGGHALAEDNRIERPSDLRENALMVNDGNDNAFNTGDFLVFYGVGPMDWKKDSTNQRFIHAPNLYSDTAYYFITFDHGAGLRVEAQSGTPAANVNVTDFNYYDVHDVDLVNPAGLGKNWYGEQFFAGNASQIFSFDLGAPVANVYCSVSFGSTGDAGNRMTASVNGITLGTAGYSATSVDNVMSINSVSGTAACNSQTAIVTIAFAPSSSSGIGYLNYIELNARRPLTMSGDMMNFRDWQSVGSGNVAAYALQGAGANTRVWDITDPMIPVLMNGTLSGSTYSFSQNASILHEFAATNNTNFLTPKFIGSVTNQNLHGLPQTDVIIVTHKDFLDQANKLAAYHREHDKLRVVVTTTNEVYNEFSSGAQDLSAIRDFARMFYKRAGTDVTQMPKSLILFGGASYDYKNRIVNNSNYIPVFESINSASGIYGFSTDDFYGFLDDNEYIEDLSRLNTLDIGIGRLPVRNVNDAKTLVDKIISYTDPSTLGPWRISSTFVADNNDDAGNHMQDAEDMASCITASTVDLHNERKVYVDAIPTTSTPAGDRCPNANLALNDQVFKGTFLINYNGHGNPEVWAGERILTQADFNSWNNPKMLPFMVTATCDFGQFDHPQQVSAAEELVLRNGGGVITVLTTTAAVYATYNHDINLAYLTEQFTRNPDKSWNTFGEACRVAKNATYMNTTNLEKLANFRKFALLGDPSLIPDFPEYEVKIDSVTDDYSATKADTVKALGAYSIKGSVHDLNGSLMTGFNGIISVSFYDKPREVKTISGTNKIFKIQDNIVYKGKASVTNGLFTMSFITPKDINYYYGTGKLSTYAQNGVIDGAGADTSTTVGGYSDHPVINTVPPVVRPYINDSLFLNGGITGNNTSLYVSFFSETGINVSGNNLGHDLIAVLDGNVEQPYILNDYYETAPNTYKRGFASYPITGLANGRHTIMVKAWDVNDNTGSGTVDFMVIDGKVVDIQNLGNYPNPFTNNTHFIFEHNHYDEQLDVKILIYNTSGKLVKHISQSFTPTGSRSNELEWDGTDENGAKLPSGIYVYKLNLSTEKGFNSTAYQKLVIVR